ncbi:cytoplasmic protein [Candidatus Roizmanbacteria bacterium CG_4_10_14_0_8_um_filter_36_36]|uniref:Cytoplasmic protein n=2 Tax=Candidatus Roizmaniibacteriota TaxID=1752723 RepID=A0A2M8KM15_9BACT|nr:MAG: cytoplasmic protein [Candidatus Roizmanbacteria bacterium CG03_land_8_20_14_0_80_36_21]PIY69618.1 MAG: cytoplasmic protein [Candidatus Roizmanbacteria bacterium CG_4_10_14_0_8_um_filter_36_36]PJA52591.1 MAG: cytoplasmic protein [Candidatus Roizmanbacteria bacterium CG_4_9_14_3_um_filter_36_11]PJC81528.1 MAG: cytoplasmic protein [Candidatus Roizmanbacteria bacterium CG_4_8_14_3_um_filter_36_10]PJE60967.1 MAG: cytoplasmic protein [Candidatus Roizmanbacteria bacterium CG10_big_fil_rev_8_21
MEDTKKRINRIIGQLRGIEKMFNNKRECFDVLQQISAVKKAIDGLAEEIVTSDICKLIPNEDSKKIKMMVERAINL